MKITGYTGSSGRFSPLGHALDDLVGDRRDGLPGHLRAVDLRQVGLHLAGREALRGQRDDQLVHPGQPPLPLRDDLRFEAAVPVAGHFNLDRPDLGQHRLRPASVAGVSAIPAVRVVLAVAEVIDELALERGLDQPLGQLGQQAALAGQHEALRAGPSDQAIDQLLVDGVENIRPANRRRGRLAVGQRVEIHHRLGHQVSHRCQSP
jgi:hypothetical protein